MRVPLRPDRNRLDGSMLRGKALDVNAGREHVKAILARHKVPRDVEFVADLPRNATGRLLRTQLS